MLIKTKREDTMTQTQTNIMPTMKVYEKDEPSLKQAQDYVGGWVELVDLEKYGCLLVDEEGRLKNKIVNQKATALYNKLFDGFIVGDVIHIKPNARKDW